MHLGGSGGVCDHIYIYTHTYIYIHTRTHIFPTFHGYIIESSSLKIPGMIHFGFLDPNRASGSLCPQRCSAVALSAQFQRAQRTEGVAGGCGNFTWALKILWLIGGFVGTYSIYI